MRPILIPITGTTDANGAATLTPRLERTGDWRNLKLALSTTAPAEWAVVQSGIPVTFGRGRRVTLGPELLQPEDVLSVQVSGGPVLAQITGSVSGVGGTESEVLSTFTPAPNTIALDVATTRQKLFPIGTTPPTSATAPSFTVGAGGTAGPAFVVPTGTVSLRIMAQAGGLLFTYQLGIFGQQSSEQYYGSLTAPGAPKQVAIPVAPLTVPVESDWDSSVLFSVVGDPLRQVSIFVSALFDTEVPAQSGDAQSVFEPQPAGWQAPTGFFWGFAAAGTTVLLAAVAGQTVRLWDGVMSVLIGAAGTQYSLQDTAGTVITQGSSVAVQNFGTGFISKPLVQGRGVQLQAAAATTVQFGASHSQQ